MTMTEYYLLLFTLLILSIPVILFGVNLLEKLDKKLSKKAQEGK